MKATLPLMLPALLAAILTFAVTPVVARLAFIIGAIDMPGERKIHKTPIARLGGVGVVASIAAVLAAAPWLTGGAWHLPIHLVPGLPLGVLPIFLVSLIDDLKPLPARLKFFAHLTGAVIAVSFGVALGPVVHLFGQPLQIGVLAFPLSVLWLIGVTNAFNIIDGLDGLSAGLALISALSMAAVFALVDQSGMSAVALVLAGSLIGFLPYNTHPARLFLGDAGATTIGFCLAAFALKGGSTLSSGFAALLPVFILGLPIADTLIAMARRYIGRLERRTGGIFVPDRNHIHHRLLDLGVDHGKAVLILYAAGLVLAGAAFVSIFLKAREAALFVVALLLAGSIGLHRLGYDEFAFIRRGTVLKMYQAPVVRNSMFVVIADLALVIVSAWLSVGLKSDVWTIVAARRAVFDLIGTFAPLTVAVFWKTGMYRGRWSLAGVHDLVRACASAAAVVMLGLIAHIIWSPANLPWSVFLIYGFVSTTLLAASRASYVTLLNSHQRARAAGTPVLIYGAGPSGVSAVDELFEKPDAALRPVAFIDDAPSNHGRVVSGLPVLGGVADLPQMLQQTGAQAVIVAAPDLAPDRLLAATETCARAGVGMFRMYVQFEKLSERTPVSLEPVNPVVLEADLLHSSKDMVTRFVFSEDAPKLETCTACGSHNMHRSHVRNVIERIRKRYTLRRLYRCDDCGWRGWLLPLDMFATPQALPEPDNLADLDKILGERQRGLAPARLNVHELV